MPSQRQSRLKGRAFVVIEVDGGRVTADVSRQTAQAILRLIGAQEQAAGGDKAFADYVAAELKAASDTLK